MTKLNTIRILLSITAKEDWPLHKFNVKNAILNGELKAEVYMEIPHGLKHDTLGQNMVYKLKNHFMISSSHHELDLANYLR